MDKKEFVVSYRDYYGQYHNHKEQMAYAATVLYLAAAAWLMFAKPDELELRSLKCSQVIFIVVIAIAALMFVFWQLRQRTFAANIVEACTRLLANFDDSATVPTQGSRVYKGLLMPSFLFDELLTVVETRRCFQGAGVSELLTYATMLTTTVLVACRFIE